MRDTPNFLIWLNIYIIKNVGRVYLLIRTGAARKPNWKVLGKKGNFLPLSKFPNTKGCRNAASARAKANSIRVATWKVSPGVLRGTHRQLRQVTESCQSLGMQTGGFSRRFTPPPPKHFALTFHFPRLFGISPEVRPRNYSEFSSLWFCWKGISMRTATPTCQTLFMSPWKARKLCRLDSLTREDFCTYLCNNFQYT